MWEIIKNSPEWRATQKQSARIQAVLEKLAELDMMLKQIEPVDQNRNYNLRWNLNTIGNRSEFCATHTRWLQSHFDDEFLDTVLPEFLVFPDENPFPKTCQQGTENDRGLARLAYCIASEWLVERGGDYGIALIGQRLRHLIEHVETDPFFTDPDMAKFIAGGAYEHFELHIKECVQILARLHEKPLALDLLYRMLSGDWDGPVTMPDAADERFRADSRYAVLGDRLYAAFYEQFTALDIVARLHKVYRLDYEQFLGFYRRFPRLIPLHQFWWGQKPLPNLAPETREIQAFVYRLGWEIIREWREPELEHLNSHLPQSFEGAYWLLEACKRIELLGLPNLAMKLFEADEKPKQIIRKMLATQGLLPDEKPELIVEELRGFKTETLKVALPFTSKTHSLVMQALNWETLEPVWQWIRAFRLTRQSGSSDTPLAELDIEARQQLEALLAQDGSRAKQLAASYRAANIEDYPLTVLEALAGWNRKQLKTAIKRYQKQHALSAYGYLPLEGGEEDVLERYLTFQKAAKDSKKYGSERQANIKAAIIQGLANLAQTAGFADLTRLEWAMESKIGNQGVPMNRCKTIVDWEVELGWQGIEPKLTIFKQGKPLKTVPAGLRKQAGFLEFKDTQTNIKSQVGRFRASLEAKMSDAERFSVDDLKALVGLPATSRLLQGLILRAEAGHYGFYDQAAQCLDGLNGVKIDLKRTAIIAHPYHFLEDGLLSDWQQEIVRRQVVQPFKQVFRELYVLTPAEEDTATFSNRFAGHSLNAKVAAGLFKARAWRLASDGDYAVVSKWVARDLIARFEFPDSGHYLAETDTVTSDQIRFHTAAGQQVELHAVPPLIFSEVMRDADLVVSVAQTDEQATHISSETYLRRSELITTLLNNLGVEGVRCEGHFAYINGQRARYRVHLISAAIHIEPGNYLCIVPDRSNKKPDNLYLPFADAEPKTSEVISKILLLVKDAKIKDPSILAQIEKATQRSAGLNIH